MAGLFHPHRPGASMPFAVHPVAATAIGAPRRRTWARVAGLALALAVVAALAATPALAQVPGETKGPSVVIFLAQLLLLMLVGRLLGEAMLRIKQPAVMGQLIAGLILGPSLLGYLFPGVHDLLFPQGARAEGDDRRHRPDRRPAAAADHRHGDRPEARAPDRPRLGLRLADGHRHSVRLRRRPRPGAAGLAARRSAKARW